jgi:hypothetical protein
MEPVVFSRVPYLLDGVYWGFFTAVEGVSHGSTKLSPSYASTFINGLGPLKSSGSEEGSQTVPDLLADESFLFTYSDRCIYPALLTSSVMHVHEHYVIRHLHVASQLADTLLVLIARTRAQRGAS